MNKFMELAPQLPVSQACFPPPPHTPLLPAACRSTQLIAWAGDRRRREAPEKRAEVRGSKKRVLVSQSESGVGSRAEQRLPQVSGGSGEEKGEEWLDLGSMMGLEDQAGEADVSPDLLSSR